MDMSSRRMKLKSYIGLVMLQRSPLCSLSQSLFILCAAYTGWNGILYCRVLSLFYKNETAYLQNLYRNGNSKNTFAKTEYWFSNHLMTVNFSVPNSSSNYVKTGEEARTKLEEQKVCYLCIFLHVISSSVY